MDKSDISDPVSFTMKVYEIENVLNWVNFLESNTNPHTLFRVLHHGCLHFGRFVTEQNKETLIKTLAKIVSEPIPYYEDIVRTIEKN